MKERKDPVDVVVLNERGTRRHAVPVETPYETWCGVKLSSEAIIDEQSTWARVNCKRCKGGWC